ncbi:C-C motif chemokine 28 [Sorex araneus]|uniref:C-C motif chemokine 28 n=1 Tax=Sorex araneus TaxID=42254 RepID=UPI002433781A|nr:C-C motif chemokine 28 [Sorex araneus]
MQQPALALMALAACVALHASEVFQSKIIAVDTENAQFTLKKGSRTEEIKPLHIKHRRICVSPRNRILKQWMKERAAKKNTKGNICHKKNHHRKWKSKVAQKGRRKAHGHKTPH